MKLRLLCLALLGACSAPQKTNHELPVDLQPEMPIRAQEVVVIEKVDLGTATSPQTYAEWLDTLPNLQEQASQPFTSKFHGKAILVIPEEELHMEIQVGGSVDYSDLRHFREQIDLRLDLGEISDELPATPVSLSILMHADGNLLYIDPMFHDDWLLTMVEEVHMGFENMSFTLGLDLLEQSMDVYWRYLDESDIDISSMLPDGVSTEEFFSNGLNPAAWARMYLLTADISDFRIDSGEVHIAAQLKEEWVQQTMSPDPEVRALIEGTVYEISFDRFTGIPTNMGMSMHGKDGMVVDLSIEFHDFKIGDGLFPSDHFDRAIGPRRTLFPLDTFVQMALGSMQGQMHDDDDDIPF